MELKSYSEKPQPNFQGEDAYHLGIELEVEAPDSEAKQKGLDLRKRPWGMYVKRDGSLKDEGLGGFEIVTHPIARKLWLEKRPTKGIVCRFFQLVKDLRKLKYNSHDGGRCGFHIHVSRKAFGPGDGSLNNEHFYWFKRLVNGVLFAKLSQRKNFHYCMQNSTPLSSYASTYNPHNDSRYQAVLITGNTAEVRIFRGNMREDRLRKNVEAVISAVEFARNRHSTNWVETTAVSNSARLTTQGILNAENVDKDYPAYVTANKATYPNLYDFLVEIGVLNAGGAITEDGDEAEPEPEITTAPPPPQSVRSAYQEAFNRMVEQDIGAVSPVGAF